MPVAFPLTCAPSIQAYQFVQQRLQAANSNASLDSMMASSPGASGKLVSSPTTSVRSSVDNNLIATDTSPRVPKTPESAFARHSFSPSALGGGQQMSPGEGSFLDR